MKLFVKVVVPALVLVSRELSTKEDLRESRF